MQEGKDLPLSISAGVCREHTLFGARNRGGRMKSRLLGIRHSNGARRTALAASLCPNDNFLNRLTEGGENALDLPLCCMHQPNNNLSYRVQ